MYLLGYNLNYSIFQNLLYLAKLEPVRLYQIFSIQILCQKPPLILEIFYLFVNCMIVHLLLFPSLSIPVEVDIYFAYKCQACGGIKSVNHCNVCRSYSLFLRTNFKSWCIYCSFCQIVFLYPSNVSSKHLSFIVQVSFLKRITIFLF